MFSARGPSRQAIERFIAASADLPLSYSAIELVEMETVHYDVDEILVAVGQGTREFDRAKAAIAAWKHFDVGWAEVFPSGASLEPGTVVAVLIRHLGFWSLNGCRIVSRVASGNRDDRFGFAYGTLTNHAESGEELFEVFLNPRSGEVMYRIRAVSRPRATLARLGRVYVRRLQSRFRRDSAEAMKRACGERS